jgi:tRNA pseudouridine38-40 synthase
LGEIAGQRVSTTAAGRTDAGVHATSQIVHFDAAVERPTTAWVRGVNALLPAAAAVLWAHPVADAFHARRKATARYYTYLLHVRGERPALLAHRAGWYHRALDVAAMQTGAAQLAGTHDFSAFRAAECQAKSPVRTLKHIAVASEGPLIRFDFAADAFLQHMVRNIVGALVYVGAEKHPPSWIGELLVSRNRTLAAPTFAPDGLYMTGADYDATFDLPPTRRPVVIASA